MVANRGGKKGSRHGNLDEEALAAQRIRIGHETGRSLTLPDEAAVRWPATAPSIGHTVVVEPSW